ncbi:MAG: signal peptidase II [Chloroflexota bacterium]
MARASAPVVDDEAGESRPQKRRRWALFLGLAGAVLLLDQLSKTWVDASFDLASRRIPAGEAGGPTEVIGELLRIAKTYNDGAIFGLLEAVAPLLGILTLFVVAGITWYEWRHGARMGPLVTIGLALLLGGALGNLIDRLRFGYVVDFVDVGIGSWRWYAFNVSDAAVFMGILVLFAAALLGDRAIPGKRDASSAEALAEDAVSGASAPPSKST